MVMMTVATSKVLLIGSGGREHALAWKLAKSDQITTVFVAPGNGGTEKGNSKIQNVSTLKISDFEKVAEFCKTENIEMVVVGPEQPLVDGIVNKLKMFGINVFGPSAAAAQLEASKAFSKAFMDTHSIPTAKYQTFTVFEEAIKHVEQIEYDFVIKASGLAAGKGVVLPENKKEAADVLKNIMVDRCFGDAGNSVVIEEKLIGPEISVFALSDGYSTKLLPTCQDHKKIGEGDKGLNTGGMGAYSPVPFVTKELLQQIEEEVIKPTITGMRKRGTPFIGCLFVGLMLTESGPKVLEYNVRFGDPETQVLIPLLDDNVDLLSIFKACVGGWLDSIIIPFKTGCHAATVVAVSEGYPGSYPKGRKIDIAENTQFTSDKMIFYAGTKMENNCLLTSGGRVLAVTCVNDSLKSAVSESYEMMDKVNFQGIYYRKDIASVGLNENFVKNKKETYAAAGVSIHEGNRFVDLIKPLTRATKRKGCDGEIGGFGGLFDLKSAGFDDGETIIVGATDGVGTKLKVAHMIGKHDTIGQDLVAMCVNDLIVQGAEPLFFLDYYACGKLEANVAVDVVKGIAEGCLQSNCVLIGGETAEMPGMYSGGDYDVAGFAVGATTRKMLLPQKLASGDVLLGIASSGVHSNGYSLVRRLVTKSGLQYSDPPPFESDKGTLGEALLTPTKIYVKSTLPMLREGRIKGMVHITGGGFWENIPRILPSEFSAKVDAKSWEFLPVFKWMKKVGNVDSDEMARTFNCGIGMVLIVNANEVERVKSSVMENGENVFEIGNIIKRDDPAVPVIIDNLDMW